MSDDNQDKEKENPDIDQGPITWEEIERLEEAAASGALMRERN